MKIYNIYGPNLNMLGFRNPSHYGTLNFDQFNELVCKHAYNHNYEIEFFQSNFEGEIIEFIQNIVKVQREKAAIIVNLGAFSHYSHAIADALEMCCERHILIEVHLSNVKERESFRSFSVVSRLNPVLFYGKGVNSYIEAIDYLGKNNG